MPEDLVEESLRDLKASEEEEAEEENFRLRSVL